jgi:hypothetical protein
MRYLNLSSECVIRFGVYSRFRFFNQDTVLDLPLLLPIPPSNPNAPKLLFIFTTLFIAKNSFNFALAVALGNIAPLVVEFFTPGQAQLYFNQTFGQVRSLMVLAHSPFL